MSSTTRQRLGAAPSDGTAVYCFVDVLGIWLKEPIEGAELAWVETQAGPLKRAPYIRNHRARFDPRFNQYLRLKQPTQALLQYLDARGDEVLMTYAELARDTICDDPERIGKLFNSSLVQRRHRKRRTNIYAEGANGSTGTRGRGIVFTWYTTKPSKVTGEIDCFHLEARLSGVRAIRAKGIHRPGDLLTYDHDLFWKSIWVNTLTLIPVDHACLGRFFDNRATGKRRRASTHDDFRRGALLMRIYGYAGNGRYSIQGLVDALGMSPFIQQGLAILLNKPLLAQLTHPSEHLYPPKQGIPS